MLIQPVSASAEAETTSQAADQTTDEILNLPPLEDGEIVLPEASDQDAQGDSAQVDPALCTIESAALDEQAALEAFGRAPTLPENVSCTPITPMAPAVDLKPEPAAAQAGAVTFDELCNLVTSEVNKRHDKTVEIYEQLLDASQQELKRSRQIYEQLLDASQQELKRSRHTLRLSLSIGAGLALVAAITGMWSASQVGRLHGEPAGLKSQIVSASAAAKERDQLRGELVKVKEATAKAEIDSLKTRLDRAVVILAQRVQLNGENIVSRIGEESSSPAMKSPSTQPVSANPDKGILGSERQDTWSVLLNGKD